MSYSGPCSWECSLSTWCDPRVGWRDQFDAHEHCRGTYIAYNPLPSGEGRVYRRCQCLCHLVGGKMVKPIGEYLWQLRCATKLAIESGNSSDTVVASLFMFSEFDHLLWSNPEQRAEAREDGWDINWSDLSEE